VERLARREICRNPCIREGYVSRTRGRLIPSSRGTHYFGKLRAGSLKIAKGGAALVVVVPPTKGGSGDAAGMGRKYLWLREMRGCRFLWSGGAVGVMRLWYFAVGPLCLCKCGGAGQNEIQ
jgi:hypothetical protein